MTERQIEHGEFFETVMGVPPDGWTLGHVSVGLKGSEGRIAVEAWRRGAFAIHEVLWPYEGGRLTHAPTGMQIWTFAAMDDAAECAERIETFADWGAIKEMLTGCTDLYLKVRAVIDEINNRADGETLGEKR